jgi:multidrug efflux pump
MNAKGHELMAATLHACRQRLRPILMTSGVCLWRIAYGNQFRRRLQQPACGGYGRGWHDFSHNPGHLFVPLFFVLVRRRFPLKERPE